MKKILIYIFIAVVIGGIVFQSCPSLQDNPGSAVVKDPEKKVLQIPVFNRDSAFSFIDAQVAFGPRVTNSEGHRKCQTWLVNKFKSYGAVVVEQDINSLHIF